MKRLLRSKKNLVVLTPALLVLLSGCSSFPGIRTPYYDGRPVEPNEEAIERYAETQQINEENEEFYFRYPLSDTLFEPSLEFSEEESVTLEAGTYTVGEELPAGRVILEGEPSNFNPEVFIINAGNMTVYDENEAVAFENHFQENVGVMQAVIDLREGYTVEVEGEDPIITVYYSDDNAEILPPSDNSSLTSLTAGHFEVGNHIEPGTYTIERVQAPRTAVLYHFTDGEINVVELTQNRGVAMRLTAEENEEWFELGRISEEEYEQNIALLETRPDKPVIELTDGDKLYLPMLDRLELEKQ